MVGSTRYYLKATLTLIEKGLSGTIYNCIGKQRLLFREDFISKTMQINNSQHFNNREEWREWLRENHDKEAELWIIFFKKHTGVDSIPYEDSVEEALCFGWIDSIIQKIDEDKYARKYTPRKDTNKWSLVNKKRMLKAIKEGRMTDIGLSKIDPKELDEEKIHKESKKKKELIIPDYIEEAFRSNEQVWENFENLAHSHRRNFVGWISEAKREETRKKRIGEAVEMLKKGEKLGIK